MIRFEYAKYGNIFWERRMSPRGKRPREMSSAKNPKQKSPNSLYLLKLTNLNGLQLHKLLKKRKRNVFYKLFLSLINFAIVYKFTERKTLNSLYYNLILH